MADKPMTATESLAKLHEASERTNALLLDQMTQAYFPDGRQAAVERLNVMAGYTPEGFIAPPVGSVIVQPCPFWRNRVRGEVSS